MIDWLALLGVGLIVAGLVIWPWARRRRDDWDDWCDPDNSEWRGDDK